MHDGNYDNVLGGLTDRPGSTYVSNRATDAVEVVSGGYCFRSRRVTSQS